MVAEKRIQTQSKRWRQIMNWVLILAISSTNYTVYENFKTEEQCMNKLQSVESALKQVDSDMFVVCRKSRPRDYFAKSNIIVEKHIFR